MEGGFSPRTWGFKLTYVLDNAGSNNSASGRNSLALPYIPMTTLVNSQDLCDDIKSVGGPASLASVSRLDPTTNTRQTYNCTTAAGFFTLVPQESYEANMVTTVVYPIVGSHDPTYQVTLTAAGGTLPAPLGGGTSVAGTNAWAYPYHSTALDANDLCNEIKAVAAAPGDLASVQRFQPNTNTFSTYNCTTAAGFFTLTPGEGYQINVANDITGWVPDHF